MTVICETCQTANRDKAKFCKGCAGKLPAFFATGPAAGAGPGSSATSTGPATPASAAVTAPAPRPVPGRIVPRWWFGAMLLLGGLAVGLVGWIALSAGRPAAVVAVPVQAVPAPAAPPASSASAPVSGPVSFESALSPGESPVAPEPAQKPQAGPDDATSGVAESGAVPAPATRAPATRAPPARTAGNGRADPRTGCEHLFFAFAARCEANHCAQAAYARHPRCDVVRAERQRDDARRNMTSGY